MSIDIMTRAASAGNPDNKQGRRKDFVAISLKLRRDLHEKLVAYCEYTGQSKTTAIERALDAYCVIKE